MTSASSPSALFSPTSRFVTRGSQRIDVHENGAEAGDPVVFLHSGGFTSRQWRRLGEMLAPQHRIVAPDLLGYGKSTPIPAGTPFHFAEDLALLADLLVALGRPAHVVGHSYGGLLALKLALLHPTNVRSLSLYEPVAFGALGENHADDVNQELDRISLTPNDDGTVDDAWLAMFVDWWNGNGAWNAMGGETKDAFRSVGWKVFQEVCSLVRDRTTLATFATIETPTLLLGGDRSPAVEQKVVARLAEAMPKARRELLEGVGHMGPITHAGRVNKAIAEFIGALR